MWISCDQQKQFQAIPNSEIFKANPENQLSLRIGFIVPFLYRFQRGIERACTHLANELTELGQQVTLLAWREPHKATASAIDPRVRVITVPYFRYYQTKWVIPFYVLEILRGGFDVLNIFFAGYGEAEAIASTIRLRNYQINFIAGYPIEQVPHRFSEFKHCGLHAKLDRIIVKSPSMKAGIAEFFKRDIDVIPNGINVNYFTPEEVDASHLREQLGLAAQDNTLITVAALEERKGVQHMIKALPELVEQGDLVHYVVVGDGPYRNALEKLASTYGVTSYVHFVGNVLDVRPYYKLGDLFILLSYGEGFPNVVLEAWSMEVPVIVSLHPPYPEIIPPSLGNLVDEFDTSSLVATIRDLIFNPHKREIIGSRSRDYVVKSFAWPIIAQRYLALFQQSR